MTLVRGDDDYHQCIRIAFIFIHTFEGPSPEKA